MLEDAYRADQHERYRSFSSVAYTISPTHVDASGRTRGLHYDAAPEDGYDGWPFFSASPWRLSPFTGVVEDSRAPPARFTLLMGTCRTIDSTVNTNDELRSTTFMGEVSCYIHHSPI